MSLSQLETDAKELALHDIDNDYPESVEENKIHNSLYEVNIIIDFFNVHTRIVVTIIFF